jgi:hypothetical protein
MVAMSQFPSPAADYHEDAISLDRSSLKSRQQHFSFAITQHHGARVLKRRLAHHGYVT